jgi:hypothetical protein
MSRRWAAGVTFVSLSYVAALLIALTVVAGADPQGDALTFANDAGVLRTLHTSGTIDKTNPFFADLGTNGRSCVTCHQPAQAWTITPDELRERFARTDGREAIFRTNDGSNCEGADVSTIDARRRAFSLLLNKGLIRVALPVPANAEFEIVGVDDPYRCGGSLASASVYRRPLPSSNVAFISGVMWDGRESAPGRAIREDLMHQARNAVASHAQGASPSDAQLAAIVDFELGLFAAQALDRGVGSLSVQEARGGVRALAVQPFCVGINDPLGMLPSMPGACAVASPGLDPNVFTLFGAWAQTASPMRQAIARGETIFNTRRFVIDNVSGLNGEAGDPLSTPIATGTCTVCHDTPNAGNHSVPMPLNIGVTDATRRTPDLPLFTLRHKATGETVQTSDPGRAMITGRWRDIGRFKGPVLRALTARAPYFHDGSAATLVDVLEFYDKRFRIQLTDREKADLLAFLQAL